MTARNGMAIVSLDGAWRHVTPALCRLLGYPAEQLVGRPTGLFSRSQDAGAADLPESLLAGGSDAEEACRPLVRADGSRIEVLVNAALMRDAAGMPDHVIVHLIDVTAQRHEQRALRDRTAVVESRLETCSAALAAAERRLETFAHGVSHDLRAPLRTIDGFAKQLERRAGPAFDAQGREDLQRIIAASQRMGSLIDSLLELNRIGRIELRPVAVDMSLLSEWVAAELQDAQPQRSARVTVQPGLAVIGDERLLKVLLTQLLCNAWQFSARRPQVEVEIDGSRENDELQLSVRDHGVGFDMAYAGKLFEPFQRLHGSEEGAGNGIGLSIAQQVVARHGGRIWAEAAPDEGATFHLTLHDLKTAEATAA